ncbi:MAG: hypothetical protein ACUVQZ_05475 [Candidatus Caldatribacteriaceae bacterium]
MKEGGKFFLLLGFVMILVAGCAWGKQPSWGAKGKIILTLTFRGTISSDVKYFVALDTDDNVLTGPKSDPNEWNNFYVLWWIDNNFYFQSPGESEQFFFGGNISGEVMEMEVDLSQLRDPTTLEIMVVTTDRGGNILDALGNYFTVRLGSQSYVYREDASLDVDDASADLRKVEVEVQ